MSQFERRVVDTTESITNPWFCVAMEKTVL
jgi:hypothetical protein